MNCLAAYYIPGYLSIYFMQITINIYFNAYIAVAANFLLDS